VRLASGRRAPRNLHLFTPCARAIVLQMFRPIGKPGRGADMVSDLKAL
jgi:hypothetical protein